MNVGTKDSSFDTWRMAKGFGEGCLKVVCSMVSPTLPVAVQPMTTTISNTSVPLNNRVSPQAHNGTATASIATSILQASSEFNSSDEPREVERAFHEKRGEEVDTIYCEGVWREFLADGPKKCFQLQKDGSAYVCVPLESIHAPKALRCPRGSVPVGEHEYIQLIHPNVDNPNIFILASKNYLIVLVCDNNSDYMTCCTKEKFLTYSPSFTGNWENIGKGGSCQWKQMNNFFKLNIPAPRNT